MFKVSRSFKRPAIENKHVKYKEILRNTSAKNKFQFCEFIIFMFKTGMAKGTL